MATGDFFEKRKKEHWLKINVRTCFFVPLDICHVKINVCLISQLSGHKTKACRRGQVQGQTILLTITHRI